MKARDKAKELVGKYINLLNGSFDIAIQCALIAVDEIIKSWDEDLYVNCGASEYWQKVKKEIKKL